MFLAFHFSILHTKHIRWKISIFLHSPSCHFSILWMTANIITSFKQGLFHESLEMISFQSSFHSASNGFNFSWHPIQDILSFLIIYVNMGLTSQSQVCLVRRFRVEFLIVYNFELVILTCNKVQFKFCLPLPM